MATPVRRSWGEPTLCGRKPEYQQSTLNPFLPEKLRCGDVPFFCYVLPSSHESLARSVSWWVCALREAPAGSLQYILTEAQHQAQVTKPVPRSQRPRFRKTPSLTRLSEWKHENQDTRLHSYVRRPPHERAALAASFRCAHFWKWQLAVPTTF